MDLLHAAVYAICVVAGLGLLCWLFLVLIPMPAPFGQVIVVIGCVIALLIVANLFFPSFFGGFHVRR